MTELRIPWLILLSIPLLAPAITYVALEPLPVAIPTWGVMFAYHLVPFISMITVGSVFLFVYKGVQAFREQKLTPLIFPAGLIVVSFASVVVSAHVHEHAFSSLSKRSAPLVAALTKYQSEHAGKGPEKLTQLVPVYIDKIPSTGMSAYPSYEYLILKNRQESPWELRVSCPIGMLNWDVFFYWPTKNYPESIYGGWVERFGDWAYVHE